MENTYTYFDSVAGNQTEQFASLSEIVKYIEDFPYDGQDSDGTIFQNGEPIFTYASRVIGLDWRSI